MTNPENNKAKILIIDDSKSDINILVESLKKDYQLAVVKNGKKALEYLLNHEPDLILLDIIMPEMDGYEVCKQIKQNPSTKEIPILFLTAKTDPNNMIRGFKLGAQDYVTKPFNMSELLSRVRTHLELRRKNQLLASMNKILEHKVSERTAQLSEANQKLLQLDKAKNDFLTLISHELRTPLTGLTFLSDIMERSNLPDNISRHINILKASTNRLSKFSEIALLITSLKADRGNLNLKPGNVNRIIIKSVDNVMIQAEKKNINIENDVHDVDLQIQVDELLIEKAIIMILSNAVKHSPLNDRVMIRTCLQDDNVVITIEDDGPGFSDEILKKLFDFFLLGDIYHHSEGLGLSLAAVKLIMEAHSGNIEVMNKGMKGAMVKLIVPIS